MDTANHRVSGRGVSIGVIFPITLRIIITASLHKATPDGFSRITPSRSPWPVLGLRQSQGIKLSTVHVNRALFFFFLIHPR